MPDESVAGVDIDAHVHVYECFDPIALVRHASERARRRGNRPVLALAESHGYAAYESIAGGSFPRLDVRRSEDPESCVVSVGGHAEAVLLSGRQLVSTERLEVLALGLPPGHALAGVPDGTREAERLLREALDAGAVGVLPWSVGKWLGRRGTLVEHLISRLAGHPRLFLGDIPARTWPWPRPRIFEGPVGVLCGTDPLPLAGAERGVGRYVTVLDGEVDARAPWTSIRALLEGVERPRCAGRRDGFLRGVVDQVRVRTVMRR